MKGVGEMKNILTSDMEIQGLEFAELVFSLALVKYFLIILPSLCSEMVVYILYHYM